MMLNTHSHLFHIESIVHVYVNGSKCNANRTKKSKIGKYYRTLILYLYALLPNMFDE